MPNTEWETPQDFFDVLDAEFHFQLDAACSTLNRKCSDYFTKRMDGLIHPWYGSVWLNPPYTRDIAKWVAKAYESAQQGVLIVCLLQGRSSDTKWWHDYVMKASEIRYIKDRLRFGFNGKFSRANISSVVVVFRPYCMGPPIVCSIDTEGKRI